VGWAKNSINAGISRRNSLINHGNYQYIAYCSDRLTVDISIGKRTDGYIEK